MNYKYLIAYLGQSKKQTPEEKKMETVNTFGYSNYTDEMIKELQLLYRTGKIQSYPRRTPGVSMLVPAAIEWMKQPANEIHRPNGPAIEYADGDFTWYKDGIKEAAYKPSSPGFPPKRAGKPASPYCIATFDHRALQYCSKEEYEKYVHEHFPEAKQILP